MYDVKFVYDDLPHGDVFPERCCACGAGVLLVSACCVFLGR